KTPTASDTGKQSKTDDSEDDEDVMDATAEESTNLPALPPYSQVTDKFRGLEADALRCDMDGVGYHLLEARMTCGLVPTPRESRARVTFATSLGRRKPVQGSSIAALVPLLVDMRCVQEVSQDVFFINEE
ncbi:unnamed protein product, partial [Discosporangium mesarthrocarpum]